MGLAGALNALIDPYGIFDVLRSPGLNEVKSRANQRGLLLRRHLISSLTPKAIILGNSRAEVGFDPEHPAWGAAARPAVNAAVPGAGIETVRQLLEHAIATGRPQVVIVGLDFVDFRISGAETKKHPSRLPEGTPPKRWDIASKEYLEALFSMDAVHDSIVTMLSQRDRYAARVSSNGFNPMQDYVRIASAEGYGTLFLQRDRENAANYVRGEKAVIPSGGGLSASFLEVRAMLELARSKGIEVHLVIYPYHAHILELFRLTGLWPAFEQWKRELVALAESASQRAESDQGNVKLWDFSGYSSFTTEAVPPLQDRRTVVKWYWEAGHFKKELGDVVLARILAADSARQGASNQDFGVLLSSQNSDRHLAEISLAGAKYREMRAEEIRGLSDAVERVKAGGMDH